MNIYTSPLRTDALTAVAIATDVAAVRRSAREVAEASLQVVTAREPDVQDFAYLNADLVRAQADAIDAAPKGPLAGVTDAIEDVIATRDMPTGHNSARYEGSLTGVDAACVDTLRHAGAFMLGKAVTTEFAATVRGGKTRNRLDLRRTPGGSSSGSAAAVAAGMAAIGLGTQTGRSTIRPAAFNGIWGWKPTWAVISREGLKQYSVTCDTLGLYSRTGEDLELLAEVFDLDDAPRPTSLAGLQVGLCPTPVWEKSEAPMRAALIRAADILREAGADVSELALPDMFNGLAEAHSIILSREGRASFLSELRNTPDLHPAFHAMVNNERKITPDAARAAYLLADRCRAALDEIMGGYDILITPSARGEAPVGHERTGDSSTNSLWTALQVPVVSAPGLTGPSDMPLGISFVARRYADCTALAIAKLAGLLFAAPSVKVTAPASAR